MDGLESHNIKLKYPANKIVFTSRWWICKKEAASEIEEYICAAQCRGNNRSNGVWKRNRTMDSKRIRSWKILAWFLRCCRRICNNADEGRVSEEEMPALFLRITRIVFMAPVIPTATHIGVWSEGMDMAVAFGIGRPGWVAGENRKMPNASVFILGCLLWLCVASEEEFCKPTGCSDRFFVTYSLIMGAVQP